MSIKIKYCLIYIFLFVLSLNSGAQNFDRADSLFKKKEFLEASIEYARVGFYSSDNGVKQEVSYRRALCYRFMNESDKSIKELQKINLRVSKEDFRIKVIYESVLNSFILKDYEGVRLLITKLKFYEKDYLKIKSVIPIYVLSLNALRRWDEAKNEFFIYVNSLNIEDTRRVELLGEIDNLYSKKSLPRKYSEKVAVNWSRFIPGSGQMYAGKIFEGVLAFSMCATFAFSGAYLIYYHYYFTGYVFGFGLLNKTYQGGLRRSASIAKTKNVNLLNLFNNKCVSMFIEINN